MNNVSTYHLQAVFSQAAYGTFSGRRIRTIELTENDVSISASQAAIFTENWQVADQYTDPITGVSATVFEAKEGGTKYLAIRGTEFAVSDLFIDGVLSSAIPPILNPQFIALKLQIDAWLNDRSALQGRALPLLAIVWVVIWPLPLSKIICK
ncbi:MAG: hypothetical protein K2Q13_12540 [Nitrosomonas sp.]|uniref:hypothetical protein n=1 Tax=Nitrosomonas sp. TaxID=42353 RepID=UPI0025D64C13|nr:hypothetical protein [Nitrosomonas sp.]MBY0475858.1 hypothetical protein [Nitrosomonas sp.]